MDFIQRLGDHAQEIQLSMIEDRLKSLKKDIETNAAGQALDKLLVVLLNAMGLLFLSNKEYRKNIKDFTGSIAICSEDKKIDVSAVFKKIPVFFSKKDGMEVKRFVVDNPTTTVTFKDGKAMAEFLLAGNPDVIVGMLNNQLSVSGNLNYLFRFVYLLWLIPEILGINDFKELLGTPA
ncbi:hypothetical protein [Desulfobacter sp.]|jgi:hypothetical protein|uniref:hypothetical protein n=1 Tax=Desulfobacter sp. TaxID=2294 RepID=UPI000E835447|nr:hypothetical protein [Desulfobacter sp.]HBT88834.1 hypothetical protein [Desulfobacter sp.]